MKDFRTYAVADSEARAGSPSSKFLTHEEAWASNIKTAKSRISYIFKVNKAERVTREEAVALTKKYPTILIVEKPAGEDIPISKPVEIPEPIPVIPPIRPPLISNEPKFNLAIEIADNIDEVGRRDLFIMASRYRIKEANKLSNDDLRKSIRECMKEKIVPLSLEKVELIREAAKKKMPYAEYRKYLIARHNENPTMNDYPYTPEDDGERKK
jgi:hypothetical protein